MRISDRLPALGAALLLLPLLAGCTVFPAARCDDHSRQRGEVTVPDGEELDVYYPVPFASPPNLQTETDLWDCSVIEQKADHFRIRNRGLFPEDVTWEARGVPAWSGVPCTPRAVTVAVGAVTETDKATDQLPPGRR